MRRPRRAHAPGRGGRRGAYRAPAPGRRAQPPPRPSPSSSSRTPRRSTTVAYPSTSCRGIGTQPSVLRTGRQRGVRPRTRCTARWRGAARRRRHARSARQVDVVRRYVGDGPDSCCRSGTWPPAVRRTPRQPRGRSAGRRRADRAGGRRPRHHDLLPRRQWPTPGDWGLVTADNTPKPVWWVLQSWAETTDEVRLPVTGGDDSLFVRATHRRRRDGHGARRGVAPGEAGPAREVTMQLPGCVGGELLGEDRAPPRRASRHRRPSR